MKETSFFKMSGSGNDFVVLDGRSTSVEAWPPTRIREICGRRTGVGADGLVILTPASPDAVRMAYWNSDGSVGAMCGNAALCGGRLAVHLGLVPAGEFCLLTDIGPVRVKASSSGEEAEINLPEFRPPRDFKILDLRPGEHWISLVNVGVPHLVIRVDDIEAVDPLTRGRRLRFDPSLGPEGANVNFISPRHEPDTAWSIRTYERGVEGETLACGTGTVAAAVATASRGECRLPMTFVSRGGPLLRVRAELGASSVSAIWLGGQGRLVFRGVWEGG